MGTTADTGVLAPRSAGPAPGSLAFVANRLLKGNVPSRLTVPELSLADVNAARDGLLRFDKELPIDEQKDWGLHLERDPEFIEPDDGAIRKADADWKLFFHYRPDLADNLALRGVKLTPWQDDWFGHCQSIWDACSNTLDELAFRLDEQYPGHGLAQRTQMYRSQNVLRVLKYLARPGRLAKDHFDRCAITFHIAESADGLYGVEKGVKTLHPTPPTPDVLCFPGDQLERATLGYVRRLWHGVDDSTGGVQVRWALVFFGKMFPKFSLPEN